MDSRTAVVGGSDEALTEALTLAQFAKEVTVIHRREELSATKILQERAFKNDRISFLWNTVVREIAGENRVEGLQLENLETGDKTELDVDGVIIAIGNKPNTDIFKGKLKLDEEGYIMVYDETKTSVDGVFAAGDAKDQRYCQAVTAAGDGCKAALDAERYLMRQGSQ